MAVEVILPKVDMDMETGQISRWYAKDGDTVTKGQLLFEIETDKAAMEVDAPASGIIANISAAEGSVVPVGQAVAWIYDEGEERNGKSVPVVEDPIVVAPVEAPVEPVASMQVTPTSSQDDEPGSPKDMRATPLARRLAREAGIDLATIQGSGPKGRVQKKDVEGDRGILRPAIPTNSPARNNAEPSVPGLLNAVWLREGEAGRLPIVLIHGFAADLNSWRGLFAGASLGHPILALDLPGHGNSPRVVPESIDDIAAGVEATLASLNVTSCLMVGHSLGGAVATVTAARSVVDVRSLVLISPGGLGPQVNGPFVKGLIGAKSEDTSDITVMSVFREGPAVSLNGSPTVSPTTAALCASEPGPPNLPVSIYFLALSHSPPAFAISRAKITPVKIAPPKKPPSASGPSTKPITSGSPTARKAGSSSEESAPRAAKPTQRS